MGGIRMLGHVRIGSNPLLFQRSKRLAGSGRSADGIGCLRRGRSRYFALDQLETSETELLQ